MPNQIIDTLHQMLAEIGREKAATPGVGETSHPVMSGDDGTQDAVEGARSAENERDVKKDIPGPNVEKTPDATCGATDPTATQVPIGPKKTETGGDPSVEDDYGDKLKDPGTTHPAKADFGPKYGSYSLEQLYAMSTKTANDLLAEIVVESQQAKDHAVQPETPTAVAKAAQAGYGAAALLGTTDPKARATMTIAGTMKEAADAAIKTAAYITNLSEHLQKQAGPGEEMPVDPAAAAPGLGGGGIEAMLAGGPGGPGAGGPGGAMGGSAGGGAPPLPGAAPPGNPAEGMPPDASHEEVLHQLISAAMEMGISPEEIVQALSAGGGGGGAPGAPGAEPGDSPGGLPPEPAPEMKAAATKLASQMKQYRRSGKFTFDPQPAKRASAIRARMRSYLAELIGVGK